MQNQNGRNFLQNMTEEQLKTLKNSLSMEDIDIDIKNSMMTSISSTLDAYSVTKEFDDLEVKNRKSRWQKIPVICNVLDVTYMQCVSKMEEIQ